MHCKRFKLTAAAMSMIMKKNLFLFCFLASTFLSLWADITFESDDALLSVGFGATFNYNPPFPAQQSQGTIEHLINAPFDGSSGFNCVNFNIKQDYQTFGRLVNGTYTPAAGNPSLPSANTTTIALHDYGYLYGTNNFTVYDLTVATSNNLLSGSFNFTRPLSLGNNVGLTCALTTPLNQNIVLDGGTLTVTTDLVCASNVSITGTGTVTTLDASGNTHAFTFGRYYNIPLSGNIVWRDCAGMRLQSSISLSGDWVFDGVCCLDGGGSTIDLSAGGSISVNYGSSLLLKNVVIKGLTNANFLLLTHAEEADGIVLLDRVTLCLAEALDMSAGRITVVGDSMFVLGNYNWTIHATAVLTVDRATLSLNVLSNDTIAYSSTLLVPTPIFVDRVKNTDNIAANITAGNLVFSGGGVIAEVSQVLVAGSIGGGGAPIILTQTNILSPSDSIVFSSSQDVDGGGSRITFANPGTPQFTVAAGQTVTLRNIELYGITNTTFSLGEGAVISIGENVIFSLAEDVVWSHGVIEFDAPEHTLIIKSDGPQHTFTLQSAPTGESYVTHLNLQGGTIVLQNVVFTGLRHVAHESVIVDGESYPGVIALNGYARVNIAEESVDHIFTVKNLDNCILLCAATNTFTGRITFDDTAHSSLSFGSILQSTSSNSYQPPIITFTGDSVINVSSVSGSAYCVFDMPSVSIINTTETSFNFGNNGVIVGSRIDVSGSSIRQTSARALVNPGTQFSSTLTRGAIAFSEGLISAMTVRSLYFPGEISSLPDSSVVPVVHYESAIPLTLMCGNVNLREQLERKYSNFSISPDYLLNLTFCDGVQVQASDAPVTLKGDGTFTGSDVINVIGGTQQKPNKIVITDDITFNGYIMFQEGAALCIECAPSSSPITITFGDTSGISFGGNSTLMFTGAGTVLFADGYQMAFNGGDTLIIGKDMQWSLSNQNIYLAGLGSVQCQDGGLITLEHGSEMVCGASYSQIVANSFGDAGTYGVVLRAKTGGGVRVGEVIAVGEQASRLSFIGNSSLNFSQGGRMIIAQNGICECNALGGVAKYGVMESIDFSNGGALYIGQNGNLLINNNAGEAGITLLLDGASVSGTGMVGVIGSSFIGQVQSNLFSADDLSAVDTVSLLTQTVNSLVVSTAYYNTQGQLVLRTLNGALVNLGLNKVITGDTETGLVSGYNALNGRRFTYDANGVLQ
ncbi:MAG: hypothetical protein QG632_162 [Candidatus Dependentiae bacterium]|nr:hypothetical protein [Candidatus Dependentiae bacterium]